MKWRNLRSESYTRCPGYNRVRVFLIHTKSESDRWTVESIILHFTVYQSYWVFPSPKKMPPFVLTSYLHYWNITKGRRTSPSKHPPGSPCTWHIRMTSKLERRRGSFSRTLPFAASTWLIMLSTSPRILRIRTAERRRPPLLLTVIACGWGRYSSISIYNPSLQSSASPHSNC